MTAYLLKAVLCSLLFFALYKFLFERERMFRFNRLYLLGSLAMSFAIPLVTFTVVREMPVFETVIAEPVVSDWGVPVDNTSGIQQSAHPDIWTVLTYIYLLVTAFLLARFAWNMAVIAVRIRKSEVVRDGKASVVLMNGNVVPYTFFNYIFINRDDYDNKRIEQEVMLHECVHVAQRHSIDKIVIELFVVFMWFNPVLYFYRRSIYLNHEFLADDGVLSRFDDLASYQELLIHRFNGAGKCPVASPFSFLITKKRLIMMTKKTSSRRSLIKALAILPVLAVAVLAFSSRTVVYASPSPEPDKAISAGFGSGTGKVADSLALSAEYDELSDEAEKLKLEHSEINSGVTGSDGGNKQIPISYDQITQAQLTSSSASDAGENGDIGGHLLQKKGLADHYPVDWVVVDDKMADQKLLSGIDLTEVRMAEIAEGLNMKSKDIQTIEVKSYRKDGKEYNIVYVTTKKHAGTLTPTGSPAPANAAPAENKSLGGSVSWTGDVGVGRLFVDGKKVDAALLKHRKNVVTYGDLASSLNIPMDNFKGSGVMTNGDEPVTIFVWTKDGPGKFKTRIEATLDGKPVDPKRLEGLENSTEISARVIIEKLGMTTADVKDVACFSVINDDGVMTFTCNLTSSDSYRKSEERVSLPPVF